MASACLLAAVSFALSTMPAGEQAAHCSPSAALASGGGYGLRAGEQPSWLAGRAVVPRTWRALVAHCRKRSCLCVACGSVRPQRSGDPSQAWPPGL